MGSFLFFHTLITEGEYPMRRATSAHVLKRVWSYYNFLYASLCSSIVFSPPAGCFLNPFYCLIRRRCFASYPLANAGTAITYHSAIFRITDFIFGNISLHFLYCLFFGKQLLPPPRKNFFEGETLSPFSVIYIHRDFLLCIGGGKKRLPNKPPPLPLYFFLYPFIFLERLRQKNIYLMPIHTYSILNGCLCIYFIPDFYFFQILTQWFFYKANRNKRRKEGFAALNPPMLPAILSYTCNRLRGLLLPVSLLPHRLTFRQSPCYTCGLLLLRVLPS